jgi:LPXTG-motif cell wall-anchored protein
VAEGGGGELPDTGGPDLLALLLAGSGVLAMTSGLLARKVATG